MNYEKQMNELDVEITKLQEETIKIKTAIENLDISIKQKWETIKNYYKK